MSDDRKTTKPGNNDPAHLPDGTASVLEALRDAVARHCHEIRQPLLGIKGYAELMPDEPIDAEMVREGCRSIAAQADRIARRADELMALFLGPQTLTAPPQPASCNVKQAIEGAVGLFRYRATGFVQVRIDVPPDLPPARIAADHLEQIAVNLVGNALDALAGRGAIQIRAHADAAAKTVIVDFADDGPGIPTPLHKSLFEPYQTSKAQSRGHGLGLAISRELAERAGATLVFDDGARLTGPWPLPARTAFRLTLPVA
ncbi:MAG TPA: HAMP domain-containing sensor histidine kinase [Polyangia bacterium]|nr:HAMP domain-containing sensor histidine kinase [Polyangia bacterium]